jgi:hypothetical protein
MGGAIAKATEKFNFDTMKNRSNEKFRFNGRPAVIEEAVPYMFEIKKKEIEIMNVPIPGAKGMRASPIY